MVMITLFIYYFTLVGILGLIALIMPIVIGILGETVLGLFQLYLLLKSAFLSVITDFNKWIERNKI